MDWYKTTSTHWNRCDQAGGAPLAKLFRAESCYHALFMCSTCINGSFPLPNDIFKQFKVPMFVFKILQGLAPSYHCDLVTRAVHLRATRSSGEVRLLERRYRQEFYVARAFSAAAPKSRKALLTLLSDC